VSQAKQGRKACREDHAAGQPHGEEEQLLAMKATGRHQKPANAEQAG
jgi:hypothetical protein